MKSLCVISPNNLVIETRDLPAIQSSDEVLIKVKAGGICGSDMRIYQLPLRSQLTQEL
jgi:L-gulonate 5-dehydrogenase